MRVRPSPNIQIIPHLVVNWMGPPKTHSVSWHYVRILDCFATVWFRSTLLLCYLSLGIGVLRDFLVQNTQAIFYKKMRNFALSIFSPRYNLPHDQKHGNLNYRLINAYKQVFFPTKKCFKMIRNSSKCNLACNQILVHGESFGDKWERKKGDKLKKEMNDYAKSQILGSKVAQMWQ